MSRHMATEASGSFASKLDAMVMDRHLLDDLAHKNLITPLQRQQSLDWLHPPKAWAQWAMLLLLAFGAGLVLAAIIFFFAFNWSAIPALAKLAMIQVALILSVLGAWRFERHSLPSALFLIAATCLVGVFLAVFGQIYQTGADVWQLFTLWAALTLVWVLTSRSLAHWLIWMVVANFAFSMWWEQGPLAATPLAPYGIMALAAFNGLFLGIREMLAPQFYPRHAIAAHGLNLDLVQSVLASDKKGLGWLAPVWPRWLLVTALTGLLFPSALMLVDKFHQLDALQWLFGLLAWAAYCGMALYFRFLRLDLPALTIICLALCLLAIYFISDLLSDYDVDPLFWTILTGFAAILVFAIAASYLRRLLAQDHGQNGQKGQNGLQMPGQDEGSEDQTRDGAPTREQETNTERRPGASLATDDILPSQFLPQQQSVLDWLSFLGRDEADQGQWLTRLKALVPAFLDIEAEKNKEVPLYLRALTGIGAIISGLLLLYLLYLFDLFDLSDSRLAISGSLFILLAAWIYRKGLKYTALRQDFLIQLALTLLQAGKVALVVGLGHNLHEWLGYIKVWPVTLVLILIAIASFLLFHSALERFFAAMAPLISMWVALLYDLPDGAQPLAFNMLLLVHCLAIAAMLHWAGLRQRLTVLFDAVLLSLCIGVGLVLAAAIPGTADYIGTIGLPSHQLPTQMIMATALALLIAWLAGRERVMSAPILAAFLGILLLSIISDAGILLAIGLMILGYATHRPAHSALGLVFAIMFVWRYYYALDLSLLQKSTILFLSGLCLLLAGAYIQRYIERRGWALPAPAKTGEGPTHA